MVREKIGEVFFDGVNTGEAYLRLNKDFANWDRLDMLDFLGDCKGMFDQLYTAVLDKDEEKLKKLLKDFR